MAPNYQNGKIYGLYCDDELIYVGSTTQSLPVRFAEHIKHSKYEKKRNLMNITKFIYENRDKNIYIELIELFPCNLKIELNKREGEIQRQHANLLNMRIAGRTDKERRDEMTEEEYDEYIEKSRNYYKTKEKDTIVCDCGITILKMNYERHLKTLEHIKHIENNTKVIIKEKKPLIYECECGSIVKNHNENRHNISMKHINYIENNVKILPFNIKIIECECGSSIKRNKIKRHQRSNKHIQFIESQDK
jgi:hypothetical protein